MADELDMCSEPPVLMFAPMCHAPPPTAKADMCSPTMHDVDARHEFTVKIDRYKVHDAFECAGLVVFNVVIVPVDISIDAAPPERLYFVGGGAKLDPLILAELVLAALGAGSVTAAIEAAKNSKRGLKYLGYLYDGLALTGKILEGVDALGPADSAGYGKWPKIVSDYDISSIDQLVGPALAVLGSVKVGPGGALLEASLGQFFWLKPETPREPVPLINRIGELMGRSLPPFALYFAYRDLTNMIFARTSDSISTRFFRSPAQRILEAESDERLGNAVSELTDVSNYTFPGWLEGNFVMGHFYRRSELEAVIRSLAESIVEGIKAIKQQISKRKLKLLREEYELQERAHDRYARSLERIATNPRSEKYAADRIAASQARLDAMKKQIDAYELILGL